MKVAYIVKASNGYAVFVKVDNDNTLEQNSAKTYGEIIFWLYKNHNDCASVVKSTIQEVMQLTNKEPIGAIHQA